jgi:hypothetical protein
MTDYHEKIEFITEELFTERFFKITIFQEQWKQERSKNKN